MYREKLRNIRKSKNSVAYSLVILMLLFLLAVNVAPKKNVHEGLDALSGSFSYTNT